MDKSSQIAAMVASLRGVDPDDEIAVFCALSDAGFADAAIEAFMDPAMAQARADLDRAMRALGI